MQGEIRHLQASSRTNSVYGAPSHTLAPQGMPQNYARQPMADQGYMTYNNAFQDVPLDIRAADSGMAMCAKCGQTITYLHHRIKQRDGTYMHDECFHNVPGGPAFMSIPTAGPVMTAAPLGGGPVGGEIVATCQGCGRGLTKLEQRIRTPEGKVFHKECYMKPAGGGASAFCETCKQPITSAPGVVWTQDGKRYHENCFNHKQAPQPQAASIYAQQSINFLGPTQGLFGSSVRSQTPNIIPGLDTTPGALQRGGGLLEMFGGGAPVRSNTDNVYSSAPSRSLNDPYAGAAKRSLFDAYPGQSTSTDNTNPYIAARTMHPNTYPETRVLSSSYSSVPRVMSTMDPYRGSTTTSSVNPGPAAPPLALMSHAAAPATMSYIDPYMSAHPFSFGSPSAAIMPRPISPVVFQDSYHEPVYYSQQGFSPYVSHSLPHAVGYRVDTFGKRF